MSYYNFMRMFSLLNLDVSEEIVLKPIMTNFRIEDSNKDRVYFDTPLGPVTGLDYTDFTISDKIITAVNTTDNYFTVSSAFTFWNNNTIRKEGGDNSVVYDFTMEYITNNIAEPTSTIEKFIEVGASGSGNSIGDPMSITGITSTTDTKYWIKAGDYGDSPISFSGGGGSASPIQLIGYKNTIGDSPSLVRSKSTVFDANEMPYIHTTYSGSSTDHGIDLNDNDNFIIKNIQIEGYYNHIDTNNNQNVHIENCYMKDGYIGVMMWRSSTGTAKGRAKDCYALDFRMDGILVNGNNCLVDGCWVGSSQVIGMDYYITIIGSETGDGDHIVRNCTVERFAGDSHGGHGIDIKMQREDTKLEYCLVDNCTVDNVRQAFTLRQTGVKYCVIKNSSATGDRDDSNFVTLRDDTSYNIVQDCFANGVERAVLWNDSPSEYGIQGGGHYNKIINLVSDDCKYHIEVGQIDGSSPLESTNNEFINCTFIDGDAMFLGEANFGSTNTMKNCIFDSVPVKSAASTFSPTYSYCDFYNSWAVESGTGNFSVNPQLSNFIPQATFTDIDVPRIDGVYYDGVGNERNETLTTVGARSHDDENASTVPPVLEYDYYVSSDGTGVGTEADPMSEATALTTIASMSAGETIAYKGGDTFGSMALDSIDGSSGNPITITSYGTGQALFSDVTAVTGWTNEGSNIWSKAIVDDVYQVFKSGVSVPNAKSAEFVTESAPSTTTFTCSSLSGRTDLVGATVFFRFKTWYQSSATISAFDDSTDTVTLSSAPSYGFDDESPFNIVNASDDLTSQDDWIYDGSTLYMYSTSEPTSVSVSTGTDNGIELTGSSYVDIKNINVSYFNSVGIKLSTSSNCNVNNNTLSYNYEQGVYTDGGTNNNTDNNTIKGGMHEGIRNSSTSSSVSSNNIEEIGLQKNATYLRSASSRAIASYGDDAVINSNNIDDVGYIGIRFYGDRSLVKYNYVENYCNFLYDGGAIYTYSGNSWTTPTAVDSVVEYNTIIGDKTMYGRTIAGIYLDDNSEDITVRHNNISYGDRAIFLHNCRNTTINNNKMYAAATGFVITEDSGAGAGGVVGNVLTDNEILLERNEYPQTAIRVQSNYGSTAMYSSSGNKVYNLGYSHPATFKNTSTYFWNSEFALPMTMTELDAKVGSATGNTQNSTYNNQPFAIATQGSNFFVNSTFDSTISPFSGLGSPAILSHNASGWLEFDPNGSSASKMGANDYRFSATAGQKYLIEFDIRASVPHWGRFNLQSTDSPYPISNMRPVWITDGWVTHKYIMEIDTTADNYRSEWRNDQDTVNSFDLDNISITLITEDTFVENSFLAYNETDTAKDIALPTGTWDSLSGDETNVTGNVSIAAYSSEIMIKQ